MWGLHVYTEGLCTGDLHKGLCMGHKPGDIYMGAYKQVLVHGELRHGGPKDKGFRAYKHNSMVCSSLAFTVVTKTWLCC